MKLKLISMRPHDAFYEFQDFLVGKVFKMSAHEPGKLVFLSKVDGDDFRAISDRDGDERTKFYFIAGTIFETVA